jgi:hypothetical protein
METVFLQQVKTYFTGERTESMIFFLLGIIALSTAAYFYSKNEFEWHRGFAYPMTLVALLQIGVGANIYLRSPKDIVRVTSMVQTDPSLIEKEEIPRMITVARNFVTLKWVEIVLIILGLWLIYYMTRGQFWWGVGVGLAIQASLMLAADYFAQQRASVYLDALSTYTMRAE